MTFEDDREFWESNHERKCFSSEMVKMSSILKKMKYEMDFLTHEIWRGS